MSDGAVYGDMLSAFPELFKEYTLFRMTAQAAGGFNKRTKIRTVYGVFRRVPGARMGIEADNRTPNSAASLYLYADEVEGVPAQGTYVEVGEEVFILKKDKNYADEGGYVKFDASLVPGPNGKQAPDTTVIAKAKSAIQ